MRTRFPIRRPWKGVLLAGVGAILALTQAGRSPASDVTGLSPFASIIAGSPIEYDTYQIKLTHVGGQAKAVFTLLLHAFGHPPDVNEFAGLGDPTIDFSNDLVHPETQGVASSTIERVVQGLIQRPELQSSGDPSRAQVSIMIERGFPPGHVVWERTCDLVDTGRLMHIIEAAARFEPPDARETIRIFRNVTVGP